VLTRQFNILTLVKASKDRCKSL